MKYLALTAMIVTGAVTSARCEDCKPLKLLNSVPLEMRGGQVLVPAAINGSPQKMLLDTGGVTSQVSEKFAHDADLRLRNSRIHLVGVTGKGSEQETRIDEFVLGRLKATNTTFQVTPFFEEGVAGILSLNFFLGYDIDLDFGAGKLNFISPDHCDGQVLYWQAPAVAAVPIRVKDGHISIEVTLDGHPLDAIVDTGASRTAMSMEIAQKVYHLTTDGPDMVELGQVNGDPSLKSYGHIFTSLGFEGVGVRNPHIALVPDVVFKGGDQRFKTGSNVQRWSDDLKLPPLSIGMEVLRRLHVYFAFREGKMYVTVAQVPAAAQPH